MISRKKILLFASFGFIALIAIQAYTVWNGPLFWKPSSSRDPAAEANILPPSLTTIQMEASKVNDALISESVTTLARVAIPPLLNMLDLNAAVKTRIKARLSSTDFHDKIVPFLLNTVQIYAPSGGNVPKSFRDVITPKLSSFEGTPGLYHPLFLENAAQEKKDVEKGEKSSGLKAKKILAATVLKMYDALYLQTNSHIGQGIPKLNTAQYKTVTENFTQILQSLADSNRENKAAADAIEGIIKDTEKKETITLALARFVFEFVERHYKIYIDPLKREYALKKWVHHKLEDFYTKGDLELIRFLEWEAYKKRFAVHITIDGLQGTLMESLTGNNPTFLKQIAMEEKKFETDVSPQFKVKNTFLEWAAANPTRLAHPEYLKFFKKLYRESKNSIARNGISTTPTISVRNLPITMTGVDVVGIKSGTSVPNFHYVDRRGEDRDDRLPRAYYFFGNDAVLLPEITARKGMKTMFERIAALGLNSMSCATPYDRGATVGVDAFLNLAIGEKVRDFGEVACFSEIVYRVAPEKKLQQVRERILRLFSGYQEYQGSGWINKTKRTLVASNIKDALDQYIFLSQKGLPTYLQIYNPWPDHFAHFQGAFSDSILSPTGELNRLDRWLALLDAAYNRAGLTKRTLFGMAGDHGLSPVYKSVSPELEVFKKFVEETKIPLNILKISSDEGEGPKVSHPDHPPTVKGYDLIVASTAGGNFMIDAFIDQTEKNWVRQPRLKELEKWKIMSGHTINLIDIVASRLPEALDYMVVRDSECSLKSCQLSLIAKRGGKTLLRDRILRLGDSIYYDANADLLNVKDLTLYRPVDENEKRSHAELIDKCITRAEIKTPSTWCTSQQWRKLTESTPRPDSVFQISHLYDTEKAGTINLFPRQGVGFNTKVPGRHAGEHYHEKDAFVGFWGAKLSPKNRMESVVNGSIAPSLYEWLKPKSSFATDGEDFGFPAVVH